jgi:hypothetical protein
MNQSTADSPSRLASQQWRPLNTGEKKSGRTKILRNFPSSFGKSSLVQTASALIEPARFTGLNFATEADITPSFHERASRRGHSHALRLKLLLGFWLLAGSVTSHAANLMINGDFTGSLSSWTVTSTAFNTGGAAIFSDSVSSPVSIFQSVEGPTGFSLSFDYFNGLSSTVLGGFVPDTFYATLFLGTTPFGSTLAGGTYDEVIPLFDLDSSGAFNLAAGTILGSSPKGTGWTRYTLHRETAPAFTSPVFMTLAFEFFNLNGTNSDSVAGVDNVQLTAIVPEPGRATFLLFGLSALLLRRRR